MSTKFAIVLAVGLACVSAPANAQAPEDRGSLTVMEWDAGRIMLAGASIPVRVLYPTDGVAPYPLVGVIHGAGRTGARHQVLAETFASRGFLVVLPDMPCSAISGCNHDENANQLVALLAWAEAQSDDASSRIAGLVDASRTALVGHSWGALASHLAAARSPTLDAVVLLDPNDDGTEGRDATASVMAPTAQLLASVGGACNSQWNEGVVTPTLPEPALQLTVSRSAHCDPEDPGDFLCPIGCGSGDADTSVVYRRYSIAWVTCALHGDPEMAAWLGGASMASDETGDTIEGVVARGLDGLLCNGAPRPDAGAPDADAGTPSDDAGATGNDAGGSPSDAGAAMDGGATGRDAGVIGASDAGTGGDAGGCACRATPRRVGAAWLFLTPLLRVLRRRCAPTGAGSSPRAGGR